MGDAPRSWRSGFPPNSAREFVVERVGQVVVLQVTVLNVTPTEFAKLVGVQQIFVRILHDGGL